MFLLEVGNVSLVMSSIVCVCGIVESQMITCSKLG